MAKKPLPTIEMLHKLLVCDADTGKIWWRERTPDMFCDGKHTVEHSCKSWNSRRAGAEALTAKSHGYLRGQIFGRMCRAHRVIWAMYYGEWPEDQIDHINHDKVDNRIVNLRSVTNQENMRNMSIPSDNTSGHIGVWWDKTNNKWKAGIQVNGGRKHLGRFIDIGDAIAAYTTASIEHGFHENHGS